VPNGDLMQPGVEYQLGADYQIHLHAHQNGFTMTEYQNGHGMPDRKIDWGR
jgi:hypothetical protein